MRVFIENGTYGLWNLGDIVMLRVAVERVRERFAESMIDVVTREAGRLAEFVSGARAIGPGDWNVMDEREGLLRRAKRRMRVAGAATARRVRGADENVTRWVREAGAGTGSTWAFVERLVGADAVMASGGGYMADDFLPDAVRVLRTLELAQRMGKKTAMFGQGFGPVREESLLELLRRVLPRLDMIGVRAEESAEFVMKLGANRGRVVVTGDDAIAAAEGSAAEREDAIGLNLRVAWYSGVEGEKGRRLCERVAGAAKKLGAEVRPVAVGIHEREDDVGRVCEWGGLSREIRERAIRAATPEGVVREAGLCRVMVTGSYHAAVFALSQGVPAIGVVASDYYAAKFQGLAGMFGREGMRVVRMEDLAGAEEALADLWEGGGGMRDALKESARKQVAAGREAYGRFFDQLG